MTREAGIASGSALDAGAGVRMDAAAAWRDATTRDAQSGGNVADAAGPQTTAAPDATATDSACGACARHEVCDTTARRCVDRYAAWELDCARLPAPAGGCLGGPRPVLLVALSGGAVAMFAPDDGHFLGFFTRQDRGDDRWFAQATQGPDQCVWLLDTTSSTLERWSGDGTAREPVVLPASTLPHSLSFTSDRLYVADGARVLRLRLDGQLDSTYPIAASQVIVGSDGSLVARQRDRLVFVADARAGGPERILLADLAPNGISTGSERGPGQVSYVGAGHALVAQYAGNKLHDVELETAVTKTQTISWLNPFGVAQLDNGRWLITGLGASVVIAAADAVANSAETPYTPHAIQNAQYSYVGRACLPDEFVRAQAPAAPVTDCAPPAGEPLLAERFPMGGLASWRVQRGASSWVIDETSDDPSLRLYEYGALRRAIGAVRPSFLSFRVRTGEPGVDGYAPVVSLRGADGSIALAARAGHASRITPSGEELENPITEWFEVQVRDIDWSRGTYDVYRKRGTECTRLLVDQELGKVEGAELQLEIFGEEGGRALLDDLVLR